MTTDDLKQMPTDELREISLQKTKRGNATSQALKAQRVLWWRDGFGFGNHSDRVNTTSDDYCYGDPNKFTKKFR